MVESQASIFLTEIENIEEFLRLIKQVIYIQCLFGRGVILPEKDNVRKLKVLQQYLQEMRKSIDKLSVASIDARIALEKAIGENK